MKAAYVDSSCLVAIAFDEPGARTLAKRLSRFDRIVSSNLLEAEVRSALVREGVPHDPGPLLSGISWIHPNRPLTNELLEILAVGHMRGADLWHLACALFLAPGGLELSFMTIDRRQAEVARKLGFAR